MAKLKDTGLVLRRSPFGESSLVVQVLTRDHGRVHFTAKGAFRPTSGYAFVLDFFHTLTLEWSHSARRELQYLGRADLLRRRRALSDDPRAYRAALMVLELTELAARPGAVDRELFDLAEGALADLTPDGARRASVDPRLIRFELAFLDHLGLSPALERCASCGRDAPPFPSPAPSPAGGSGRDLGPRVGFSAGAGGRLCQDCASEARASGRRVGTLPVEVLDTAARLARGGHTPANPELLIRVRDAIERFLNYHLETRPRTQRDFLAMPNRNAP